MQKNTTKIWLGLILAAAFLLRFIGLGSDELIFDEGLYAFRSIGYLDYLESPYQTTPIQWFAPGDYKRTIPSESEGLPTWTHLSFHDHPPLFFLVQHMFFKIFKDSLFVSRLPSALFGLASVYLIYLIASKLINERAGLISAFIFAVSFVHTSVSRLAMMESVLFLFVLLNIYYFLKLLEDRKHWAGFGITLGLAFLTKYVAVFLIPTYFIFLIISRRDILRDRRLYYGFFITAVVFSPVIIYNIQSYKTFGHFDLQLAYLLGQKTPWPVNEFGGKTQDPLSHIWENLTAVFSLPFLITSTAGLGLAMFKKDLRKKLLLMFLVFLFIALLLTQTGSAVRFTALYIIPFTFFVGALFIYLYGKKPKMALAIFILLAAHELFFTAERVFINKPNYGVAQLDNYLDSVLGTGRSEAVPAHPNPHLNKVIQKYAAERPATMEPTGLIYDDNLSIGPMLWLFSRRQYYHGLPVMAASQFQESLKNNPAMFNGLNLYFVKAHAASPLKPTLSTEHAADLENLLIKNGNNPEVVIKTAVSDTAAFKVYRFSIN